jgi:S1-C subfamily serine protease
VVEVDTRGPAYEAGMRVGDVIIQIGSHTVNKMKDILEALSRLSVKEEVEVGFIRLNAKRKALLRLKENPMTVSMTRDR